MAHFLSPQGRRTGYDVDNKLAPGSVSGMRVLTGQRREIVLWGGQSLVVTSANPSIVPNDGFQEHECRSDGLRVLKLLGRARGTATLEAGARGSVWCSLRVDVVDADLSIAAPAGTGPRDSEPWDLSSNQIPLSGSIPVAVGMSAATRIPVPGTNGLAVELRARGWTPKGGSTSTLFMQDVTGKRHLRLDYGYNVKTKTIDYHWNQKGTHTNFGISDHAPAGKGGGAAYKAAKYLKWGGRSLLVVGAVLDGISIAQADRPLRRATEVVAGWAGAWAGCKVVGAGGAKIGSIKPGLGTAIGALGGCIIGGAAGYYAGSGAAGVVWDWAEGTTFTPLPEAEGG